MSDAITRLNTALEGRYRIDRELGAGGTATVYLAEDLKQDRRVALYTARRWASSTARDDSPPVVAENWLEELKAMAAR